MAFYSRVRKDGITGGGGGVGVGRAFWCCLGKKKGEDETEVLEKKETSYGSADGELKEVKDEDNNMFSSFINKAKDKAMEAKDKAMEAKDKAMTMSLDKNANDDTNTELDMDDMNLEVNNPAYQFEDAEGAKHNGTLPSYDDTIQSEQVKVQQSTPVQNGFSDDEDVRVDLNLPATSYIDKATREYGDIRPKTEEPRLSVDPIGVKPYWNDKRLARQVDDNVRATEFSDLHNLSDFEVRDPKRTTDCVDYTVKANIGYIDVSFQYIEDKRSMRVIVINVHDLPEHERGAAGNVQVRMLLLPKRKIRHKTRIRSGQGDFNEEFNYFIPRENVVESAIRFRVYVCKKMRKERLLGESNVAFGGIDLDYVVKRTLPLESQDNNTMIRADLSTSMQSLNHHEGLPELLIGLAFNGSTGRLTCEIQSGSNFKDALNKKPPDSYVKVTLLSGNQQQLVRSKTSARRSPNPPFQETFMYQVKPSMLEEVTLMIVVLDKKRAKGKDMLGWFSVGNNCSGEEEIGHWQDMLSAKGETVSRWHILIDP